MREGSSLPSDRLAPCPPAASGAAVKPAVGAAGPEHQEGWAGRGPWQPLPNGSLSAGMATSGQTSARTQAQQTAAGMKVDTPDPICDV